MMHCPLCGQAAHTRTSHYITTTTKERYNQCTNINNINCGHTFITHETFTRSICVPQQIDPAPLHPGQNGQGMLQFG
ncbi:ogr/Delta-like zinc finger family protein [Sodalis sp.]|uniref:ogr/Delta-like zinc finger family protein n=1 Tax=Sodalis sp. (in: enterobacteria) TaxID=1898979 RepID=UPI003872CBF9